MAASDPPRHRRGPALVYGARSHCARCAVACVATQCAALFKGTRASWRGRRGDAAPLACPSRHS